MMTRAELAFSALDTDKTGYITLKQLKKLSNKLLDKEVKALMLRVGLEVHKQTASLFSISSWTRTEMESWVLRNLKFSLTMQKKDGEKQQKKLKR